MKKSKIKHSQRKNIHRHIKLAVVPHKANQFRPHLVRSYSLFVLVLFVAVVFGISNFVKEGSTLGVEANFTANQLLDETNIERNSNHMASLQYNEQLSAAAFLKAQDMFRQQYWAHVAPDGTTPWQWFGKAGYNYSYAGENLAKNFTSASATVAAWMASPTHRANILNSNYSDVGFAVVDGRLQGRNTTLIVALFGQPVSESAVLAGTSPGIHETSAPIAPTLNPVTRMGIVIQSMAPTALGSVILLIFASVVALVAHAYRRQLPKNIKQSWRYHHGLYKAAGLMVVSVVFITLYSGGQI